MRALLRITGLYVAWLHMAVWYYRAADRQIDPLHKDRGLVTLRLNALEDELKASRSPRPNFNGGTQ